MAEADKFGNLLNNKNNKILEIKYCFCYLFLYEHNFEPILNDSQFS